MKTYSSQNWMLLFLLSLIWGFSFYFMKNGLKTFTWDEVAALRISLSFICTLPLLLIYFKKLKKSELKYYGLVGLFGSGLPAFCFTFSQTHLESSIAGVLNSLTPVFTFLLGVLFFHLSFEKNKLAGLFIALIGAVILVIFDKTESGESNLLYSIPVFIATISYAMSANIVKRFLQHAHPLAMGAAGFSFIGIPAIIYLSTTGFMELKTHEYFYLSIESILALSIFGTVLASIGYYTLIQKTDPIFGSLVTYLIPLVAIIIGLLDGEELKLYHFVGMLFILTGIYAVNYRKKSAISS